MARARDPNRDKAFEIYKQHDGNITNRAIAEMLGVPEKTIGSWKSKSKDNWDAKLNGVLQSDERSTPNKKAPKEQKKKAVESEEVIHFDEVGDDGLTDKQRLFCYYYVQSLNATSAYQKAYKCSRTTAMVEGSKCLRKPKVKALVDELKAEQLADVEIETRDVLLMYRKIAFADITDFIDFSQVESETTEITVTTDEEGREVVTTTSEPFTYTKFAMHHSEEIDGTLITELSKGKDGMFKVKLADKMAALAFLAKYTDLLNENERKQLQVEKTKAEIAKVKSETKGLNIAQARGVDLSKLSTEELRALAARNKR